jgi:hypothetical protein
VGHAEAMLAYLGKMGFLVARSSEPSAWVQFFLYNNYNNYIINNKSDKTKFWNLRMTACHCKCATVSDVFK